ncbi:DNA-directed RNA polymerase I subunit RPA1 [Cichlidogyrus casuarinus]|uniref:DNA-directed RNA polymerase n=1 Tax=Cichlidogyrus casuarinus TaxID=1844966 RepID=A0ABD2PRZ1_9PLAT
MVNVGAKGGLVNAQQMSVALGQIELEGRRVPLMLSGRSLPSFPPYDVRPRAGGMCTHRFLSSMPPQELFFHSMAGRDGLIDTAVKTSRSGYLQRSIIKHMEDLTIQYDETVRDAGKNIVQFKYGDDGIDVCQTAFLTGPGIEFYLRNIKLFAARWGNANSGNAVSLIGRIKCANQMLKMIDTVAVNSEKRLLEVLPNKKMLKLLKRAAESKSKLQAIDYSDKLSGEAEYPSETAEGLRYLMKTKVMLSKAPAGDPVGLIAAQSIGEPSTQMTLNTFHFAGRGEMNVTLGIPRLREILMTNSKEILTPFMEVPVVESQFAKSKINEIAKSMYKLRLMEVIDLPLGVQVDYATDSCTFTFNLKAESTWSDRSNFAASKVVRYFERVVFPSLAKKLEQDVKDKGKTGQISSYLIKAAARSVATKEGADEDEEEEAPKQKTAADGRLQRNAAEWNAEDGAEAVRRRRLDAELDDDNEELGTGANEDADDEDVEIEEIHRSGANLALQLDSTDDESSDHSSDNEASSKKPKEQQQEKASKSPKAKKGKTKSWFLKHVPTFEEDGPGDDPDEASVCLDMDMEEEERPVRQPGMEYSRIAFVKNLHLRFTEYSYDTNDHPKWLKLTILMYDPKEGRIGVDLKTMICKILEMGVLSYVPGLEKVIVDKSEDQWMYKLEGFNFKEMLRHDTVFDLSRLYMNNVNKVMEHYGIEAARAAIIREVVSVFSHYGIHVNSRHLGLVADYMTRTGQVRAFNRMSMQCHPSPLQRATFETSMHFIKGMVQEKLNDNTMSPSGSILASRIVRNCGTNCFGLVYAFPARIQKSSDLAFLSRPNTILTSDQI